MQSQIACHDLTSSDAEKRLARAGEREESGGECQDHKPCVGIII